MQPGGIIDVAAGLVFRAGKLLITQRRPQDHLGGFWEFPGGKVEANESFQSCLVRELREELGIEIRVGDEMQDVTHFYPEKAVHVKFFRCELLSGDPSPLHCHALTWITRADLASYEFPAADEKLLGYLTSERAVW